MKMTVGSPNPARDWSRSSTPVAHSESATPSATIATGTRSHTKIATTDGQRRLAGELLPLTLHREHDQIATLGHHSRVRGLADEA